eukprot:scaffold24204_cov57-Attheya_sp.AAC.3
MTVAYRMTYIIVNIYCGDDVFVLSPPTRRGHAMMRLADILQHPINGWVMSLPYIVHPGGHCVCFVKIVSR